MNAPIRGGGRPQAYKTADGKRVPGVTTIVGRFKESGGLVHWAWQCGVDGIDYRKARDDAASAGTIAHDMIECAIHGTKYKPPPDATDELLAAAAMGLAGFRSWQEGSKVEILHTEVPLVSERYRYGGTIDAIGRVAGALVMLDWKTSNRIYPDYIVQVSAYRALWEEHHPDEPITGLHLLRVGKEHGDFHHHSWPLAVLDGGWSAFKLMRDLYDADAMLKRAVG